MSYFLHRSLPDRKLLRAASSGQLSGRPDEMRRQALRLMEDSRFERFLRDFCDAWLNLREMDFTAPDAQLYPEFDPYLRYSMPLETRAFLGQLFSDNLPVENLVKSDFGMLNQRLAAHYGIEGVNGPEIRKVQLPERSVRGGLLSQASILKVSANGTHTSPVVRGVWVMERILGETPQPPPPGIPGVEPDVRGAATLRELLKKHRSLGTCNRCHQAIDPPGFALEAFNPIGGFRKRYRSLVEGEKVNLMIGGRKVRYRLGAQVDDSGQTGDGKKFRDFEEFRTQLIRSREQLAYTFASKLLTFGSGRELGFSDRQAIETIVRQVAANGYRVRDILLAVVSSPVFLSK
ncbi:MAG: DUF1592 domain-containing protein [Planctomycetota bacterium]|nr:DUF1592 domain-containing protein [Planctomycetota bacterium]